MDDLGHGDAVMGAAQPDVAGSTPWFRQNVPAGLPARSPEATDAAHLGPSKPSMMPTFTPTPVMPAACQSSAFRIDTSWPVTRLAGIAGRARGERRRGHGLDVRVVLDVVTASARTVASRAWSPAGPWTSPPTSRDERLDRRLVAVVADLDDDVGGRAGAGARGRASSSAGAGAAALARRGPVELDVARGDRVPVGEQLRGRRSPPSVGPRRPGSVARPRPPSAPGRRSPGSRSSRTPRPRGSRVHPWLRPPSP